MMQWKGYVKPRKNRYLPSGCVAFNKWSTAHLSNKFILTHSNEHIHTKSLTKFHIVTQMGSMFTINFKNTKLAICYHNAHAMCTPEPCAGPQITTGSGPGPENFDRDRDWNQVVFLHVDRVRTGSGKCSPRPGPGPGFCHMLAPGPDRNRFV